jgi:hypothetical protein
MPHWGTNADGRTPNMAAVKRITSGLSVQDCLLIIGFISILVITGNRDGERADVY